MEQHKSAPPSSELAGNGSAASVPPDFVLQCEVAAPLAKVFHALSDLHSLAPLHPFMESIEDVPARKYPPIESARWYRVVDRIPFMGIFPLKLTYEVALQVVNEREVHGYAWQSPGILLHTIYSLNETEGGNTRIQERCRVQAPVLLYWYTVSQARKAHAAMLKGLKFLLEGAKEEAGDVGEEGGSGDRA